MADEKKSLVNEILEYMDIKAAPDKPVDLMQFREESDIAEIEANKRVTAALRVFIGAIAEGTTTVEKIDKTMLDQQIAAIDEKIAPIIKERHAAFVQAAVPDKTEYAKTPR